MPIIWVYDNHHEDIWELLPTSIVYASLNLRHLFMYFVVDIAVVCFFM